MKIYFTPRDMILSRYNDEILTQDPNKRLQVPPAVKEVQVFSQTLHKLNKVNIPKLAIEKMENFEIEQKDREYTKLINDNKYIKIKIPSRRLPNQQQNGDMSTRSLYQNTTTRTKTQNGKSDQSPSRQNFSQLQKTQQNGAKKVQPHQTISQSTNENSNQQQVQFQDIIKTPLSQEQAIIEGTILEEKEERRKILQEMEERLRKRNSKSKRELIVKNPLGINESDYDTKVYRNTITKQDRTDDVSSIDEGKQMVFALPSISTKKAKQLHGLVTQNIIREDRQHRNQCSRNERLQYHQQNNRNLTLTRCAFFPPTEFSFVKDSFIKRLNVKNENKDQDKKGLNTSRTMELLNQTASSFNLSPDKTDKHSVKSRNQQTSRNINLKRKATIFSSPMHNQISMMHQTIQHFYNPEDDKVMNGLDNELNFTKSMIQQQQESFYRTQSSFQLQTKENLNITTIDQNYQTKTKQQISEFELEKVIKHQSKNINDQKQEKPPSLSPFKKYKSSPTINFTDAILNNDLNKRASAIATTFSLYTPMSQNKSQQLQLSPTQQKKYMIQKQLEKQFDIELKKFEDKFPKTKFEKALDYFQQAYDPTQTSQYDLPFKKKVTSKILNYISQGEQNEKQRLLQGGSKSGTRRLKLFDQLTKQMSEGVLGEIKKAKVLSSVKLKQVQVEQINHKRRLQSLDIAQKQRSSFTQLDQVDKNSRNKKTSNIDNILDKQNEQIAQKIRLLNLPLTSRKGYRSSFVRSMAMIEESNKAK